MSDARSTTGTPRLRSATVGRPVGHDAVAASFVVRVVMGPMTKILNPGIRKLAGRRHIATVAQIRHRGRRSQRAYVTPVSARRSGTLFLVPLTFGNQSDWCLNVLSAGGCTIRWRGEDFETSTPTLIDRKAADPAMLRAAFKPHERLMFRVLGIKQFLKVNVVAPASPVNR